MGRPGRGQSWTERAEGASPLPPVCLEKPHRREPGASFPRGGGGAERRRDDGCRARGAAVEGRSGRGPGPRSRAPGPRLQGRVLWPEETSPRREGPPTTHVAKSRAGAQVRGPRLVEGAGREACRPRRGLGGKARGTDRPRGHLPAAARAPRPRPRDALRPAPPRPRVRAARRPIVGRARVTGRGGRRRAEGGGRREGSRVRAAEPAARSKQSRAAPRRPRPSSPAPPAAAPPPAAGCRRPAAERQGRGPER